MVMDELIGAFLAESPVAVMARGLFEFALDDAHIDAIFQEHAQIQYQRSLLFSHIVDLMSLVVCQTVPSLSAAIKKRQAQLPVTRKAIYDKINQVEPNVCQALLRSVSTRLQDVLTEVGSSPEPMLPGYRLLILDGNHLPGTQHRLQALRDISASALPGKALVVFDPQMSLVCDVIPCEDGHAQERRLIPQWLDRVQANEVWVADRNFCTVGALRGLSTRSAAFVIRQHGQLPFEVVGERMLVGRSESATIYEQTAIVDPVSDTPLQVRRITVVLDTPTRNQEGELHVLTNLPGAVADGLRISEIYRKRWKIEAVFGELKAALNSEVETLGYPKAALFTFCTSLLAYNVISSLKQVIQVTHGPKTPELSTYYLADDISGMTRALMLSVFDEYWDKLGRMTAAEMAVWLKETSRKVMIACFTKTTRKPKDASDKKRQTGEKRHVATQKVLEAKAAAKRENRKKP